MVEVLFILSTIIYLYFFIKEQDIKIVPGMIYSVVCFGLMLLVKPSILGYVAMPWLKDNISFENHFAKGYTLSLTNGRQPKDHIEDLNGAQFLLFGIKAINGASPVGNKEISRVLDTYSSQAYFNTENTVRNLSSKIDNVCKFALFNIDSVVMNRESVTNEIKDNLLSCGFMHKPVRNQNVDFFVNESFNKNGSASYYSNSITNLDVIEDGYNTEKYKLSSNDNGFIFFSRVAWHGYDAKLNGENIPVLSQDGILKISIPKKVSNAELEIKYFPHSWKYSLWVGLLGMIIAIVILYSNRMKRD